MRWLEKKMYTEDDVGSFRFARVREEKQYVWQGERPAADSQSSERNGRVRHEPPTLVADFVSPQEETRVLNTSGGMEAQAVTCCPTFPICQLAS